ncbi:MAG: DUF4386 domain-containing protein [Acidimicrobiia bacterium]
MIATDITRDNVHLTPNYPGAMRPGFSPRRAARIAGVSYILLFVLAIFGNFVVVQGMVDPDSGAATLANITRSIGLFRLGLIAFMVIFLLDVVVAWALHMVFREVDHDVSLGAAWFRVVYTVLLGVALVFFYQALHLVSDAGLASAFSTEQIGAQTLAAMQSFNDVWLVGLAAFGIHLVIIGYLVNRSGYTSRVLGWLLVAAGVAYILDTTARTLLGNYADFENLFLAVVAIPSMVGEGWLGLWLLPGNQKPAS